MEAGSLNIKEIARGEVRLLNELKVAIGEGRLLYNEADSWRRSRLLEEDVGS